MTADQSLLPRRKLGPAGPDVSVLCLGSWHIFDRLTFEEGVALLTQAVEAGVNLFDIGVYGEYPPLPDGSLRRPSWTDVLFGQMMRVTGIPRDRYMLSEKLWLWDYPKRNLTVQLEAALRRVGSDHADIGVVGEMRNPQIDIAEVTLEVGRLLKSGLLRYWGVNNWSAAEILRACEVAREHGIAEPVMVQQKYSLSRRAVVEGGPYRALQQRTGISVQASDVLESGYLAGRQVVERQTAMDPGGIRDRIIAAQPQLAELARRFDCTPAQLAIAFTLTDPSVATALVGASSTAQLTENLAASRLLQRSDEIREAVAALWFDKDIVSPEASWSAEAAVTPRR